MVFAKNYDGYEYASASASAVADCPAEEEEEMKRKNGKIGGKGQPALVDQEIR